METNIINENKEETSILPAAIIMETPKVETPTETKARIGYWQRKWQYKKRKEDGWTNYNCFVPRELVEKIKKYKGKLLKQYRNKGGK